MFFDVPIAEPWPVDILSLLAYLLLHSTMPIVVAVVTAMAMMTTMMTLAKIAGDVFSFAEDLCIIQKKYCHRPNMRSFVGYRYE